MTKINLNRLEKIAAELSSRKLKREAEHEGSQQDETQVELENALFEKVISIIKSYENARKQELHSQTEEEPAQVTAFGEEESKGSQEDGFLLELLEEIKPLITDDEEATQAIDFDEEEIEEEEIKYFRPEEIVVMLSETIMGQEMATQDIAIAVANHTQARALKEDCGKSNVILVGETGSGKTQMMESLKEIVAKIGLSLVICDATKITDDGYIGPSANSVLTQLYSETEENMEVAEWSIVYIDEFDKLLYDAMNTKGREGVFNSFLKIIEGGDIPTESSDGTSITFNTNNTLFIIGGVFAKLGQEESSIGFGRDLNTNKKVVSSNLDKVTPTDLMEIGVPRELVGRFDVITKLNPMNEKILREIFRKRVLPRYKKRFGLNGLDVKALSESQIEEIIKEAMASKSGARGLFNKLPDLLREKIFGTQTDKKPAKKVLH